MTRNDTFVEATQSWLRSKGFSSLKTAYNCPFDLLVNGKRVEVKESRAQTVIEGGRQRIIWKINIHRHNKLDETQVDIYIFRLLGFPEFTSGLYLLLKPPIRSKTVRISVRSLIQRYAVHIDKTELLEN